MVAPGPHISSQPTTIDAQGIDIQGPVAADDPPENTASSFTNLHVLESPQEHDPALGFDPSLSRWGNGAQTTYRVYKRRFFGLSQLVLLNMIVSWDWLTFSPVTKASADYFRISETAINWLSTLFLLSFCLTSPFTIYTIDKAGPRGAIRVASCLILIGNWIRYGGTRGGNFGALTFGHILVGLAQPFILALPTRYSDVWFSEKGRVSATAVASLANPLGAALAQLIHPIWATQASHIPNMVLYISIISTVACIPSFFIPSAPPTPPSASASAHPPRNHSSHSQPWSALISDLKTLLSSPPNLVLILPFWIYVALFNSLSSLLNQILYPYGYTESEAGIAGALLILVGLVSAAVSAPLIDRYKVYLSYIKLATTLTALSYLIMLWAPPSRTLAYPYVVLSILGAASFGLMPVALEFLVEISYPLGPEVGSTVSWTGGQFFGGIFVIVEDALKAGPNADPPYNMSRALIFQAVMALTVLPLPLWLGFKGAKTVRKRLEVDKGNIGVNVGHGGRESVGE